MAAAALAVSARHPRRLATSDPWRSRKERRNRKGEGADLDAGGKGRKEEEEGKRSSTNKQRGNTASPQWNPSIIIYCMPIEAQPNPPFATVGAAADCGDGEVGTNI